MPTHYSTQRQRVLGHKHTTPHHYRSKSKAWWHIATDTHNHKLRATRIAIHNSHVCDHTLKRSPNCSSTSVYAHTLAHSHINHYNYGTLPSHCLLRAVIVYKPTLRQTWPWASPWPQYAFKISMFKAVCDSH